MRVEKIPSPGRETIRAPQRRPQRLVEEGRDGGEDQRQALERKLERGHGLGAITGLGLRAEARTRAAHIPVGERIEEGGNRAGSPL